MKVTSKWNPVAKKVRKVYDGHLGTVTEKGFVPKKSVRVPVNAHAYSKEFGATWAVSELTQDIHEKLKKHFPDDADWLYVTAMIRCIKHCALRYTSAQRPGTLTKRKDKNMSAPRIKLIGEGYYHIYSRFVLGEFLLAERKEIAVLQKSEWKWARICARLGYDGQKGSVSKGGEAVAGRENSAKL